MSRRGSRTVGLDEFDARHARLAARGGDLLRRLAEHVAEGDTRLRCLRFDPSAASFRLWNLLLTEEDRLRAARRRGATLVGALKDVGTVPALAYGLPDVIAFYPDGAWWTPCLMEHGDGLLAEADRLGIPDTFCPVRGMLGAFVREDRFPRPDLLVCSSGAACDDFSAVVQRLYTLGFPVHWWDTPPLRPCEPGEPSARLADGTEAPAALVTHIAAELRGVAAAIGKAAGRALGEPEARRGIRRLNRLRRRIARLRASVYAAPVPPLPALEMLIADLLAIHGCSDPEASLAVVDGLLEVARRRRALPPAPGPAPLRLYWVNPVADLRALNLLDEKGACLCGAEFMFAHALTPADETGDPFEALARGALLDPMAGSAARRAERILREARAARAEAILVSRVPGASHSATEGQVIARLVRERTRLPVVEIEVPPLCEGIGGALGTRLEAALEAAQAARARGAE